MIARRDIEPATERPDPSDKPEVVALGPGHGDQSFTLQAIMAVQRDIGALGAKLDRVIHDSRSHGEKLDELRHQVSFVRGAIWVGGALIAALLSILATSKIHLSLSEPPAPTTDHAPQRTP